MTPLPFGIVMLSVNAAGHQLPHVEDAAGRRRRASAEEAMMWQRIEALEKEIAELRESQKSKRK